MSKIPKVNKVSLNQIFKKKKLELKKSQTKIQPPKVEQAVTTSPTATAPKDTDRFDTYLRETARELVKKTPRYELNVYTTSEKPKYLGSMLSENSIWAPWSKLFKRK